MSEGTTPALEDNKAPTASLFKRIRQNPYVSTTGILFAIVAVVAALLAFVNMNTKPLIDKLAWEESVQARAHVLPAAKEFVELDLPAAKQVLSLLEGRDGGVVQGYICEVETLGYKGRFTMLVGVDLAGAVTGVSVITPTNETPDVGTRTEDPDWLAQFVDKTDAWALQVDGGSVQAVSGATVSSRAVANGVAAAVSAVREIIRGGDS